MINKQRIFKIVSILIFILFIILTTMNIKPTNSTLKTINQSIDELSMREAYDIGIKLAKEWNKDALLYHLTSTDEAKNSDIHQGSNGKRRLWNLDFAIQGTNEHLVVSIKDGKIFKKNITKGPNFPEKLIEDFSFDSSHIIREAIKGYNLQPGKDWAIGYHFELSKIQGVITMSIIGLESKDNHFARIQYDAISGNFIDAIKKVPVGGGMYLFNDNTFDLLTENKSAVTGITSSPDEKSFIIWGYRNTYSSNEQLFIKKTNDLKYFEEISTEELKEINKIWYSYNYANDRKVYIFDGLKIIETIDFKQFNVIKQFPIEEYVFKVNKNYLALLSKNELYFSLDNGENWEKSKVPLGAKSVDIDSSGQIYLLSENDVFIRGIKGWESLYPTKNYNGFFTVNNQLFIYDQKTLSRYDGNTRKWIGLTSLERIEKIFTDSLNGDVYYGLENEGFLLRSTLDRGKINIDRIQLPDKGVIVNVASSSIKKGTIYLMAPEPEWQTLERERY
jgi:hypothetical protein